MSQNLLSAAVMIGALRVNMLNQDKAVLENSVILDKLAHRSQLARIYTDFYSASLFFNYNHNVEWWGQIFHFKLPVVSSDFILDFWKLPFPSHLGIYIVKIGKISTKIHEIGKIKAIFGVGMTPI